MTGFSFVPPDLDCSTLTPLTKLLSSGLFAPFWDDTATGIIVGITSYTTKHHIARVCLSRCVKLASVEIGDEGLSVGKRARALT